jgi:hypothetical protein
VRYLIIALRILVPIAIIAAIVGQLVVSVDFWHGRGVQHVGVNITNFFSFFTIDSNVFSAVILLIGAWLLIKGSDLDPTWFLVARASIVTYMVTTGVVYNLLLRGIELPQGSTLGWSNEVLHVIAPIYLLLDWLFAPGRRPLKYSTIWIVIIFPIVWAIYTMIRAPFVIDEVNKRSYWYPYPFLNPNTAPEGYLTVGFYIVLISGIIALVGFGIVWLSTKRVPGQARATPPATRSSVGASRAR